MKPAYTGVGSRTTPRDILTLMYLVADHLSTSGYTLRSGHASGADMAFEKGAGSNAHIYLPWPSFGEGEINGLYNAAPSLEAIALAALHHPNWANLGSGPRLLHARNSQEVLGRQLDSPSKFLLCWTPGGHGGGGTGQAIRIANAYGVPVFDLYDETVQARLRAMMGT